MAKAARKSSGGLIQGIAKKATRGFLKEATEGKPITKVPPEATGITQGYREFLDDENSLSEFKRRMKQEGRPTPVGGKPPPAVEFPDEYTPSKSWKGIRRDKRGGGIELGKVGGKASKRRADKKAR